MVMKGVRNLGLGGVKVRGGGRRIGQEGQCLQSTSTSVRVDWGNAESDTVTSSGDVVSSESGSCVGISGTPSVRSVGSVTAVVGSVTAGVTVSVRYSG